jgi:L-2-hydroxyglutarate oxidase LhgO
MAYADLRAHADLRAGTSQQEYHAQTLINCAGLHSDRLTRVAGSKPPAQIVPFRGEYFELKPEAEYLCNGLIYPVPDPKFPFLGVHFTRMIHGGVECGPNAVLAFAREGYHLTDVVWADLWETLRYAGFRKLAARHWRMGLGEMWRSASKRAFVKALQQLVPAIQEEHLVKAPAGIRAQVVLPDGGMMDDFAFVENGRVLNVVNAPSPAATSSLSIGKTIVEKVAAYFED